MMLKIKVLAMMCALCCVTSAVGQMLTPVSREQLDQLLQNTSPAIKPAEQDDYLARELVRRGLGFRITHADIDTYKKAGAGPKTISILEGIFGRQPLVLRSTAAASVRVSVFRFEDSQESQITRSIMSELRMATQTFPAIQITYVDKAVGPAQEEDAVKLGVSNNSDIIIWGWVTKGPTSTRITSNVEVLSDISNDLAAGKIAQITEETPAAQVSENGLKISRAVSALTLVSLAMLNYRDRNYIQVTKYLSKAFSLGDVPSSLLSASDLHLMQAESLAKQNCEIQESDRSEISRQIDEAIRLGAAADGATIIALRSLLLVERSPKRAVEIATEALARTKNADEKTALLVSILSAYTALEDEIHTKSTAVILKDHLLALPETDERLTLLSMAYLLLEDTIKAGATIDKAFAAFPQQSAGRYSLYLLKGWLYGLSDSYELAIENFLSGIQTYPRCSSLYTSLADAYDRAGRSKEAIATYNQAIDLLPSSAQLYIGRASLLNDAGDSERALANYLQALDLDPTSVDALRAVAKLYESSGKNALAKKYLDQLIALNADDVEALEKRGQLALSVGDVTAAIGDFRRRIDVALASPPTTELETLRLKLFIRNLYLELLTRGFSDAGIEFSDKAILLFPKEADWHADKAVFLGMKRQYAEGVKELSVAVSLDPKNPKLFSDRASQRSKLGDSEGAKDDLGHAIDLSPDNPDILDLRADVFMHTKDYDRAAQDLIAALRVRLRTGKSLELGRANLLSAVSAFLENSKPDYAVRLLEEFTKSFPTESWAIVELSDLVGDSDPVRAIGLLSRVIDKEPVAGNYAKRARLRSKIQDREGALADIELAIKLQPAAELFAIRSEIHKSSGDLDSAVADLKRAIDLENNELRRALYQSDLQLLKLEQQKRDAPVTSTTPAPTPTPI